MRAFLVAITSLMILAGCASGGKLPPQQVDVTLIKVERLGSDAFYREIQDVDLINKIITVVNSKQAGWREVSGNDDNGNLVLKFYKKERFVGNFYIGRDAFGRDYGTPYSLDATEQEISEFEAMLDMQLVQKTSDQRCTGALTRKLRGIVGQGESSLKQISVAEFNDVLAKVASVCNSNIDGVDYSLHFLNDSKDSFYIERIINSQQRKFYGPYL